MRPPRHTRPLVPPADPDNTPFLAQPPMPGWGTIQAHIAPTYSPLASWSWRDVARGLACGLAGALFAALLAVWLAPDLGYPPAYGRRLLLAAGLFLLWSLPLTAGLCLPLGHLVRARQQWQRRLGAALLVTALGTLMTAAVAVLPFPVAVHGVHYLFHPFLAWTLLGLDIGLALVLAFPRERPPVPTLVATTLAGAIIGLAFPHAAQAGAELSGFFARLVTQVAILLPAGAAVGLLPVLVTELSKREWLLVIFGDLPGHHLPLTSRPLTIGTAPDNDLVLDPTGMVLPHHAVIRRQQGQTIIEPCTPQALIFRYDRRIGMSELFDGDELQIGETVLRYYMIQ